MGTKVNLRDGNGHKFATTMVLQSEMKIDNPQFPGEMADYVLVRGGINNTPTDGSKTLKLTVGWENVILWKKTKKNTPYAQWPGVLQKDFNPSKGDMGTKELMRLEDFLIDVQHLQIFGGNKEAKRKVDKAKVKINKKKAKQTKKANA